MTQLYLIRHGQAVVNVEPIIGGMRGDTGLTPLGIQQAQRLRDRLLATHELKADVLICSTMPRARETAAILADAFDMQPLENERVCELNPGEADGLTFDEFRERYGELRFDPKKPLSPGGETWGEFQDRVSSALRDITGEYKDKTIAVVCHGWVIEASFGHFLFGGRTEGPHLGFQVANTSLTHWEEYSGRRTNHVRKWRLSRYNDDVHLHAAVHWKVDAEGFDHPAVPIGADE